MDYVAVQGPYHGKKEPVCRGELRKDAKEVSLSPGRVGGRGHCSAFRIGQTAPGQQMRAWKCGALGVSVRFAVWMKLRPRQSHGQGKATAAASEENTSFPFVLAKMGTHEGNSSHGVLRPG